MDLLGFVAVPAAYRVPPASGAPATRDFQLPAKHRQVVLVVSDSWSADAAELSWWQRPAGTWVQKQRPVRVMLGAAGMGWGQGLLPAAISRDLTGPRKREGDQRAPAGVFRLSRATGYRERAQVQTRMPYTQAMPSLRCVDDPASSHYNQLVERPRGTPPAWSSDEAMLRSDGQYALTIAVDHNRNPTEAGAGSCIFLHSWPAANTASPGCTMLDPGELARLLAWLNPADAPVLVQLPRSVYQQFAAAWDLPR
jgi:L,D-peptidoglycan transpeptidase YkuD (ErfK/YbiS/YcfS/YnhG family)